MVYTNIGNPHAVSKSGINWPRQVLALLQLPYECGIDHPSAPLMFQMDVIEGTREMRQALDGQDVGPYMHSKRARRFREDVACFIERRDRFEPGLRERGTEMSAGLDCILGFSYQPAMGKMYCFPRCTRWTCSR